MAEVANASEASDARTADATPPGKFRETSLGSKVSSSGALSLSSTDAGPPGEATSRSRCFSSDFLVSDEEEDYDGIVDHDGIVGVAKQNTADVAAGAEEGDEIGVAKPGLQLLAGACQIPHPEKAGHGGEDSFFMSKNSDAVGVADGVSEWGWRFGMNPRVFSDELMAGAQAAAEQDAGASQTAAKDRAASVLSSGHANVKSFGAATALVMVLDAQTSEVGAANLGDSSLRQFRRSSSTQRMEVVGRTKEQLHEFNRPRQLSRVPRPDDFPRLLAEGKKTLVQAVKRCKPYTPDEPSDAELYTFKAEAGDLFILGSDGLFDNLYDAELCDIINNDIPSTSLGGEAQACATPVAAAAGAPGDLAKKLAEAASRKSACQTSTTPFSESAKAAGFEYVGGIQDDITVVVAWAVWA